MKPQELLDSKGIDLEKWGYIAQAPTTKSIIPYLHKDCIIAYLNEEIGICFIIKTAKSYFAFYGIQKEIYLGGMGYIFRRVNTLKQALKVMGDKIIVLNQEELDKIKSKIMLTELMN